MNWPRTPGLKKRLRLLFATILLAIAGFCSAPAYAADMNRAVQKAIKLYEKGDYDKALKIFVKVLHVDPNHSMAREYMLLCSQKIVEKKLGGPAADTLEKEIAAELHFQETAATVSTGTAAMSQALTEYDDDADLDISTGIAKLPAVTAQSLLDQSGSLTDDLRRRHLGVENIVQLEETGRRIEVTLYLNRLFLPYSDVLRDESFVILNHVTDLVKSKPKRKVVLKAIDSQSPAIRKFMPALPARRCTVVMSYLVYGSFLPADKQLFSTP